MNFIAEIFEPREMFHPRSTRKQLAAEVVLLAALSFVVWVIVGAMGS